MKKEKTRPIHKDVAIRCSPVKVAFHSRSAAELQPKPAQFWRLNAAWCRSLAWLIVGNWVISGFVLRWILGVYGFYNYKPIWFLLTPVLLLVGVLTCGASYFLRECFGWANPSLFVVVVTSVASAALACGSFLPVSQWFRRFCFLSWLIYSMFAIFGWAVEVEESASGGYRNLASEC